MKANRAHMLPNTQQPTFHQEKKNSQLENQQHRTLKKQAPAISFKHVTTKQKKTTIKCNHNNMYHTKSN
jgi:hypothetical protein